MDKSLLDCILNPVRMRIIQSLTKNKNMTVQQIGQQLTDVPQATLYRHLNKLLKAGAITVVSENKVRGTIEKVYAVTREPYEAVAKEVDRGSKSGHLNLFYNYLMTLLGDFQRYIEKEDIDTKKDGVTFRSAAIYMSDDEYSEFLKDLVKAFDRVLDNRPAPRRRLRKVSTIIMPVIDDEY